MSGRGSGELTTRLLPDADVPSPQASEARRRYTAVVDHRASQRTARAALVAGALALLTLAGHTAGGDRVDPLGLALVSLLSVGLAVATTAGRSTLPRLLAVLLAGQALLHLVLTFTAGHAAHGVGHPSTAAMIGGHVLAAGAAAVLVSHADGLIARWIAFVTAVIGPRVRPALEPTGAAPESIAPAPHPLVHLNALLHQVVRRGPPAGMHLFPA
jgi:hypothetical protein